MSAVLDPPLDKNRTSMSRALGAAFLSHQVAELERNAPGNHRSKPSRGRGGRGGGARRSNRDQDYDPDFDRARARADFGISSPTDEGSWRRRPQSSDDTASESASPPRAIHGHVRSAPQPDVIVVDGSVLIHALGAVQRWCRNGRTQVVIPLEALNTLDVLKSGTSHIAARSRAASRLLEEEVGVNPRIRVQGDDAFIPWDTLAAKSASGVGSVPNQPDARWKVEGAGAPEWMKRMLCCAKWEAGAGNPDNKRVVLAVVDAKDTASTTVGRHDSLVDGELVREWSAKLGLEAMEVEKDKATSSPGKGERRTRGGGAARSGGPPPGRGRGRAGLVEKPAPAIMVPPAGKVIRVLARGEKLEPE
ncbi:hypothetical protein BDV93DRAFT_606950 [Ceratobasidium sp. AG-I]|nr:hypothetical protein BDV93DRAFT_606950 [Ceratobasidium sp. AG-I]